MASDNGTSSIVSPGAGIPSSYQAKFNPVEELGRSGLMQYGGFVLEEILPELRGWLWRRVLREMIANDAVINSLRYAITMLARQVTWDIAPASTLNEDMKAAAFVKDCLMEDMSSTWKDTLSEALTFLDWGWAWLELVYKKRLGDNVDPSKRSNFNDGRVGWRKWAIRAQESLFNWDFDTEGGIHALVQQPPPDYIPRTIPIQKSLHFRTTVHKNNPEGESLWRGCWTSYYKKNKIETIECIGIERDLAGLVVISVPAEILQAQPGTEEAKALAAYKKMAVSIKRDEQEGIVFPRVFDDKGNLLYEIKLLSTGGQRQFDTDKTIQRHDQRILMRAMADFLMMGHGKTGSFAMISNKTQIFSFALESYLDSICDVVNRHGIPRLMRLNGKNTERLPKLTHGKVESVDLADLGAFIKDLSGANVSLDPKQQNFLLKQAQLPVEEETHEETDAGEQGDDSENELDLEDETS